MTSKSSSINKFIITLIFLSCINSKGIAQCSVIAGNDTTICQGQPLIRIAPTVPTGATIQWYLDGNSTNILSTTATLNTTPNVAGTRYYIIKVTTGSGPNLCTDLDTIKVIVNPSPRISGGTNQTVCQKSNESITATFSPSNGIINWYLLGCFIKQA